MPTLAHGLFLSLSLSMCPGEAKGGFRAPALEAQAVYHAPKVPLLGTGVIFDGQLQRHDPAIVTGVGGKDVIVVGVTLGGDALFRKGPQL
jgi:hypothetical protein